MRLGRHTLLTGRWLTDSQTIFRTGHQRYVICTLLAFSGLTILMIASSHILWSTVNLHDHQRVSPANTRRKNIYGGDIFLPTLATDAFEDVLKESSLYMTEIPAGPQGNETSGKRKHGIVPVICDDKSEVSETLRLKHIEYLNEYKNPCWHEPLDRPIEQLYTDNSFAQYFPSYFKAFGKIKDQMKLTKSQPKYRLRCVPYFFLAGQPKCGSTDFYKRLITHPDIVSPPNKESHFWGKLRYGLLLNYSKPVPFSDYVDIYDGVAMELSKPANSILRKRKIFYPKITGDASVSTLWSNDDWWKNSENCGLSSPKFTNAHHVHAIIPQAKIIVILRNPIDRLYSDFLYFQRTNKSREDFHQAVEDGIQLMRTCLDEMGMRACIYNSSVAGKSRVRLRVGLYFEYLQDWLALFPRSQIAVVRLEDYSARPLTTVTQIFTFLKLRKLTEIEQDKVLEQPKVNTRRTSDRKLGGMWNRTRNLLHTFYHPHNVQLAKLLADDRFLWSDFRYSGY